MNLRALTMKNPKNTKIEWEREQDEWSKWLKYAQEHPERKHEKLWTCPECGERIIFEHWIAILCGQLVVRLEDSCLIHEGKICHDKCDRR